MKAQAETTAKHMMTTIIKEKRMLPYDRCTDPKLSFFKDTKYISDTCYQIFGEVGKNTCKQKNNFCRKCCRHHLGVRLVMTYEDCFFRCRSLQLNGVDKLN